MGSAQTIKEWGINEGQMETVFPNSVLMVGRSVEVVSEGRRVGGTKERKCARLGLDGLLFSFLKLDEKWSRIFIFFACVYV